MRSVVSFLTIENNSRAGIYHCLCSAYGEENVMNLRNIQRRQLMSKKGELLKKKMSNVRLKKVSYDVSE